ncbi:Nuclease sbcCD subunit D [Delftia tsuruhatensis]|uniref:exonuclease subunit SbcD n=1 Tax=Delftia tsuruhatensis TaxID=180282 RepID=UPI001E784E6C|nr:exonuclease subunit SbcD [Delftia tsuruhatensis]CAB5680014.1 Nuclease sbcCD subunit D [Delftia tsuruhatensis]CAC9693293.1 Nuclease sbcCD subunit D [Delftia tsuruhatensis]
MRLLHTSDWHLGQHFMGKSRQAEHAALIRWLLEQVDVQAVDAVLIAGDIFDTGSPPSHARELYSQLVVGLHAKGVALLLLGGNHDSVATLAESRALLACLDTTVVATVGEACSHVVPLPLRRRPGQPAEPGCLVCALPFLRPRDLVQSQAGQSAEQKQQALQSAIQSCYQAVHAAALERRAALGLALPIVATGHLTTVGASSSESVREIYVGSLDAFPTSAFPPADYVALGHIHQPQKVGGLEHIRYSGSPIALSFDESRQAKQMLLVDLDPGGLRAVTPLPVPCFQPLATVSGSLAALPALMKAVAEAGQGRSVWLEVVVEQDDYLANLGERVQTLAEGLPLELLRVRRQRGRLAPGIAALGGESLHEISPDEVFERRLALEALEPAMAQALTQRYRAVVQGLDSDATAHGQEGAGA